MFWLILLSPLFVQVLSKRKICDFDAVMEQYLVNDGFHRNLTYEVTFGNIEHSHWYAECIVGLDQLLPHGVFANSDELEDFLRMSKLSAVLKNRVNIELPAEESRAVNVYILTKLSDITAHMWLPVHARYHAARRNGGFVSNEIPPPEMYMRCPDDRIDKCLRDPLTMHINSQVPAFFCNDNSQQKCIWKRIPYVLLTSPPVLEVPVGNTLDYNLVASVTAAVVVAGSLYLLKSLHEFKLQRFKKKK